jgi:hypothetical protein
MKLWKSSTISSPSSNPTYMWKSHKTCRPFGETNGNSWIFTNCSDLYGSLPHGLHIFMSTGSAPAKSLSPAPCTSRLPRCSGAFKDGFMSSMGSWLGMDCFLLFHVNKLILKNVLNWNTAIEGLFDLKPIVIPLKQQNQLDETRLGGKLWHQAVISWITSTALWLWEWLGPSSPYFNIFKHPWPNSFPMFPQYQWPVTFKQLIQNVKHAI